jgi:(E)-4-hydroxy-3-methylbut-2-enyl-diphosphate synthase
MQKYGAVTAEALCESAVRQVEILNSCGFYDIIVSIKASDVFLIVEACRLFDGKNTGIPQHIGLTEAGTLIFGLVKSSVAIFELLKQSIGDTLRVSLTGDPVDEVAAAKALLLTFGQYERVQGGGINIKGRQNGFEIISCPTCGRCNTNLFQIVSEVENRINKLKTDKHIKVAIMGCAVNGPGEARGADIGISCGAGDALLFKHGEIIRKAPAREIINILIHEIESIL